MSANLYIPETKDKKELYEAIYPQLRGIISDEKNLIANLANISAILKEALNFFWVGFYITEQADEMVLGPFQGPIACTRIKFGRGVCGKTALDKKTIIVPNVDEFSDHIACSSESKSEIVVPLVVNNYTKLVLDVDSDQLNDFDETDKLYLEKIIDLVKEIHFNE